MTFQYQDPFLFFSSGFIFILVIVSISTYDYHVYKDDYTYLLLESMIIIHACRSTMVQQFGWSYFRWHKITYNIKLKVQHHPNRNTSVFSECRGKGNLNFV